MPLPSLESYKWELLYLICPYLYSIKSDNLFSCLGKKGLFSLEIECVVDNQYQNTLLQVWKGQGSRKWKHGQHDGFFVQFESPSLRQLWFIPSSSEMGQTVCRFSLSLLLSLSVSLFHSILSFMSVMNDY